MPYSKQLTRRFQKLFLTQGLFCLRGAGWKSLILLMRDQFSATKCPPTKSVCLMLTQMHFPTWDGPKGFTGEGGQGWNVGMHVCVAFRGMKLFVFFCLYRINSVTSLPLLPQDPAHLGTEDLNTLGQGYTLTVPRAPLIQQAFSM